MTNSGQIRFGVRPDMGTRQTVNSPATYRDGQWHHIVGTLSGAGMKLFIDGSMVASNASVTKAQVYRGYWRVGGDNLGSWPSAPSREAITAQIDEVAVYPVALPASRIEAHYTASGRVGPPPNVVPNAAFTTSSQDLTTTFTSMSNDPDGTISLTSWDFGDGTSGTGTSILHNYATAGTYPASVTVTDNRGDTDTSSYNVTVSGAAPALYAGDLFGRTVVDDFGTADIGGQWTDEGGATSFAVNGGAARIAPSAVNSDRVARLAVNQRDTDTTVDMSIDRSNAGGDAYVSLLGRRTANNTEYRLRMRYQNNGTLVAYLVRVVNNTDTILTWTTVPGITPAPGDVFRLRLQLDGGASTLARAKVWRATAPEPAAWLLTNTSAPPASLQGPGDVGILFYHSGGWTGTPSTLTLDNLRVAPIGGAVLPPNVPPVASFTSTNTDLTASLTSTSTDSDGSIAVSSWSFPDFTTTSGTTTSKTFPAAGTYPVTLTVTDNRGGTNSITQNVTVTDPPANIPPVGVVHVDEHRLDRDAHVDVDRLGRLHRLHELELPGRDHRNRFADDEGVPRRRHLPGHAHRHGQPRRHELDHPERHGDGPAGQHPAGRVVHVDRLEPHREPHVHGDGLRRHDHHEELDLRRPHGERIGHLGVAHLCEPGHLPGHAHGHRQPRWHGLDHPGRHGDRTDRVRHRPVRSDGRNGFGTADLGGAWSLVGAASSFSVNGSSGRIAGAVGSDRSVFLTGVSQRDVDETVDVSIDRAASGSGAYVSLIGRRVANNTDYRLRLRWQNNNTLVAYLVRVVNGTDTIITWTNVNGITPAPGDVFRIRLQVSGGASTLARAKVWRASAAEPAAWLVSGTDAPPAALQVAGGVGVIHYHSSTWTGTASILTVDNFTVAPLP